MGDFSKNGRLGNMLFQYSAIIGFSEKYKTNYYLPEWKYNSFFNECVPQGAISFNGSPVKIAEPNFHYSGEYFDQFDFQNKNYDLTGYFQSEKYFIHCKDQIKNKLSFKKEFIDDVRFRYSSYFEKETIAIHVRRGDYVNNSFYYQLPINYFVLALMQIPGWKEKNIFVFSDDPAYTEIHFKSLPNVSIISGNSDVFDLCLMSLCDYHVLSNSSYSWWGAYLSNSKQVIYPTHYFTGNQNMNDFWPENWKSFDHEHKKIDLSDTTFMIPLTYDHKDRLENVNLNVRFLCQYFDCKIIIGENISDRFKHLGGEYMKFNYVGFHRTKMLNKMAEKSTTPIIANWDADVFVSPFQILMAVEKIRSGADMVYPYDGNFVKVTRRPYMLILDKSNDLAQAVAGKSFVSDPGSFGGAIFFKKTSYFEGGGENENFISWGPEDHERYVRFTKLGYKVERIKGSIYHLEHYRGTNSSYRTPFKAKNKREYEHIASLSAEDLKEYINTWKIKTKSI